MRVLLSRGAVFKGSSFHRLDVALQDGVISCISPFIPDCGFDISYNLENRYLVPGFVDVHVHLREPGFSYKETIRTGTLAAARGGYTCVCSMPNLSPCPDTLENLQSQLEIIKKDAAIDVKPYGCITMSQSGEKLAQLERMAPYVCGFSDDGRGVQSGETMRKAMVAVKRIGKMIATHCEDMSVIGGAHINECEYARKLGIRGISAQSEWSQLERDLGLVREIGCRYHACHLSTAKSVELMREAKREGLPVSCETAPHYLLLCEQDLRDDGRYKMNPPLRTREDMLALQRGLADGTIDAVATDHAPHSQQEKSGGLLGSLMGVSGLEAAFAALYTGLVKTNVIAFETLIERMSVSPRKMLGLPHELREGAPADITVLNTGITARLEAKEFVSMGKSTPFDGMNVCALVEKTFYRAKEVYGE